MPEKTESNSSFVVDGYERARKAMEPEIRAEVEAKYTEQLTTATIWQRWKLRRQMKLEIDERIHQIAPPDAEY